jgi:hypothetical protein
MMDLHGDMASGDVTKSMMRHFITDFMSVLSRERG